MSAGVGWVGVRGCVGAKVYVCLCVCGVCACRDTSPALLVSLCRFCMRLLPRTPVWCALGPCTVYWGVVNCPCPGVGKTAHGGGYGSRSPPAPHFSCQCIPIFCPGRGKVDDGHMAASVVGRPNSRESFSPSDVWFEQDSESDRRVR